MLVWECENSNIEFFYCKDCNFHTELTVLFKQHVTKFHASRKKQRKNAYSIQKYICDQCSFETHFVLKWLQHVTRCLKNNENWNTFKRKNVSIYWYQCQKCPYKSKDFSNLKRHINIRHINEDDVKWFECKKCPYKAKQSSNLKCHINACHLDVEEIKWYICEVCSYRAKQKGNLRRHINTHRRRRDKC